MNAWRWVTDADAALLTDLYQLTMAQAYVAEGLQGPAVFDLFVRRLPPSRNFLLACGLDSALHYLETLTFGPEAIAYLGGLGPFTPRFLAYLAGFRFTGDVDAMPEGTPCFAGEPLLTVSAPLPEAQLVETFLLNQVHLQTMAASKAVRVVTAADGRSVADFGLRHMHGADAGLKAARAFSLAGVASTSNVLAGQSFGIPVSGTVAHSYIEAHAGEPDALRAFLRHYPETVLLVDTYDTLQGVRHVIDLARELGPEFRVRGIRLDSGDLAALARAARALLDAAGLGRVQILASGNLDETAIAALVAGGAPIDGFGVGTLMGVSSDAPYLDVAYKLVEYAGAGRMKTSPGKATMPGRKQVVRVFADGVAVRDVVGLRAERLAGEPLLRPAMRQGKRSGAAPTLDESRQRAASEVHRLPARVRALAPAVPPYSVEISAGLARERDAVRQRLLGST
ncbi:MAG: nicotinate phosphoribosyltransferase [Actinobacteria bacterium]|nr:nicotinate phosphoribosyltransferase [Actinomycetota bacterium]